MPAATALPAVGIGIVLPRCVHIAAAGTVGRLPFRKECRLERRFSGRMRRFCSGIRPDSFFLLRGTVRGMPSAGAAPAVCAASRFGTGLFETEDSSSMCRSCHIRHIRPWRCCWPAGSVGCSRRRLSGFELSVPDQYCSAALGKSPLFTSEI